MQPDDLSIYIIADSNGDGKHGNLGRDDTFSDDYFSYLNSASNSGSNNPNNAWGSSYTHDQIISTDFNPHGTGCSYEGTQDSLLTGWFVAVWNNTGKLFNGLWGNAAIWFDDNNTLHASLPFGTTVSQRSRS